MLVSSLDSYAKGRTDGFIVDWVRVLAKKVDKLTVLTYKHNPKDGFASNTKVVIIGGANFITRTINLVIKTVRFGKQNDVLFAHILEMFGIVGGLVGKLIGKRSYIWYCQGYNLSKHFMAQLALSLVDRIFTSTDSIKDRYIAEVGGHLKDKIVVVGHGIYLPHYG